MKTPDELIYLIRLCRQFRKESYTHALKGKEKKINLRIDILQYFHVSFIGDRLIKTVIKEIVITCIVKVCQLFDYLLFTDDHSRVVLHTSTTESDYINANYIEVSLHVT